MRETLAELRRQGIKLVCVTNKPVVATDKTLDKAFGPDYFDYVVCDDGIIPKKPDPSKKHHCCGKCAHCRCGRHTEP